MTDNLVTFLEPDWKPLPDINVLYCYPWQEEIIRELFPGYDIKLYQWVKDSEAIE